MIISATLFLQFILNSSSFFGIPSKTTPGIALEVEQPGIEQLSPGISKLISELIAIRNLTNRRFIVFAFSANRFTYIYFKLKKTGSSFLPYVIYLTKTVPSTQVSRTSVDFLWLCDSYEISRISVDFLWLCDSYEIVKNLSFSWDLPNILLKIMYREVNLMLFDFVFGIRNSVPYYFELLLK